MSEIVNVGIQQGGVENALPVAMRASTMEKMRLVLAPEEAVDLLAAYTRVEKDASNAAEISEKYPILGREAIYLRRTWTLLKQRSLNMSVEKAMLTVSMIESIMADPQKSGGT